MQRRDPKFDYFKRHLDLQMQAASAWIAYDEGRKEEAVDLLRRAADAEDILGKHPVSPGALVPAREQLGDLLLELGRPKEARAEFEAALKIYPERFRGLYGAALVGGAKPGQGRRAPLLCDLAERKPTPGRRLAQRASATSAEYR